MVNHHGGGTQPRGLLWHTRDDCRTLRSGALPSTPSTRKSGGRRLGTSLSNTRRRRTIASTFGRAAAPDGDAGPGCRRFPSVAVRRGRSAGIVQRGDPPLKEPRTARAAESWEWDDFSQSVSTRTPLSAVHAAVSLPSDRSQIAPGPARSVLLIGAGSAPNQSWTIRLEYPSGTGDPNLPASAPAGTDLRPNLAEEVSSAASPDRSRWTNTPEPPFESDRTGDSNGDEPRPRFGLQALACGEKSGHSQRSPAPKGGGSCVASCGALSGLYPEGECQPAAPRGLGPEGPAPAGFSACYEGWDPRDLRRLIPFSLLLRGPRTAHPRFGFEGFGTGANRSAPESWCLDRKSVV